MTNDEVCELHGLVNIAESRHVTLGWSEIIGGYNTADQMTEIGPKSR